MIKKNWISGEELKKRWGIENPDLLEYMLTGDLDTYTHSLEVLPKEYIREMTSGPSAYLSPDWPEAGYDGFWFRIENVLTIEESFSFAPEEGGSKIRPPGAQPEALTEECQNLFRFMGDSWRIFFDGRERIVSDIKGMHILAYLLEHVRDSVRAEDLDSIKGRVIEPNRDYTGKTQEELEEEGMNLNEDLFEDLLQHDKKRIEDILSDKWEEFQNSTPSNRSKREEEWEKAREHIRKEYRVDVVPQENGKLKFKKYSQVDGKAEKARSNVKHRINEAIKAIEKSGFKDLAKHLRMYLKTGTTCIYDPPPKDDLRLQIYWE
jgi:hypothetical protein